MSTRSTAARYSMDDPCAAKPGCEQRRAWAPKRNPSPVGAKPSGFPACAEGEPSCGF